MKLDRDYDTMIAAHDAGQAVPGRRNTHIDMDAMLIDVDHAIGDDLAAQIAAEPIFVKLLGREWEFPGAMPPAAVARTARWRAAGGIDTFSKADQALELVLITSELIPTDTFRQWGYAGVSFGDPRLEMVVGGLLDEYGRRFDAANPDRSTDTQVDG